ncbi:transposase [Mycobacterium tuberculosis]|nr:transposase [Mycobacterium tuberculosis]
MARLKVPEGWCVQAFRFTLNPTQTQAASLARHFGARRKAFNWTVTALKADIKAWRADGTESAKPSLRVLRKRWNTVKDQVCVNAQTGQVWWPECSKEAYADGIAGAVDAYWNWQSCRAGKRAGKTVGVPRFKKKGRDADRVCFTTGAMRVEPDRRHLTLPVIGTIRTYENTRRLSGSSPKVGRGCWRSPCAATAPAWMRACGCSSNAPNSGVWRFLIHGWVSTLVCGVWPLLQTLRARCLNKCRILARLMLRCAGCAASAAHAHAARKAHAATVSAPPNCPGCTVGSTMSVPTTCTC